MLLVACLSLASTALAQISTFTLDNKPDRITITFYPPKDSATPAVAGAPFSADEVHETVKTLADGTHVTDPVSTRHIVRDSHGRSRTDRPIFQGISVIEIRDRVEGSYYLLDDHNKVAHRFAAPQTVKPTKPSEDFKPAFPASPDHPQGSIEQLGSQWIEGLSAQGVRQTIVWPAGSHSNDRPITSVTETWYSPELQTQLQTISKDPRFGDTSVKLIHIDRTEPDPALLRPPQDYRIVDETASFTMTVPRPR